MPYRVLHALTVIRRVILSFVLSLQYTWLTKGLSKSFLEKKKRKKRLHLKSFVYLCFVSGSAPSACCCFFSHHAKVVAVSYLDVSRVRVFWFPSEELGGFHV